MTRNTGNKEGCGADATFQFFGLIKPREIGRALLAIWSDLTAERVWQYRELSSVSLAQSEEAESARTL